MTARLPTSRLPLTLLALAAFAAAPAARAATDIWNGSTDLNWSTPGNWQAGLAPSAGDSLVFGALGGTLNNDLSAGLSFAGLTFNSTAPAFILNGNSITAAGPITDNSASLETIDLSLALSATQNLSAVTGASLVINGPISGGFGITKIGNGLVTLTGATSGANSYTGITSVNTGTLKLDFTTGGSTPTTNIISTGSPLSVGGGNLWIKGASASSTQAFTATTVAQGQSTLTATGGSTLTLGAITPSFGGVVEFVGPATIGAGEVAVPATGTITTTNAGAGTLGLLTATPAGMLNSAFSTVGLYDWASTDLAGGTAGTSPYTVIGGSQVTGFYTNFTGTVTLAGNANLTANVKSHNTDTPATIRFDAAVAGVTIDVTSIVATGGILITPNVGANNTFINNDILNDLQAGSRGAAAQTVLWQNNILGWFYNQNGFSDAKSGAGTWVQAGPGTVSYTASAVYTGQTYLDGGMSLLNQNTNLGNAADAEQLNLSGGTIVANGTFALDNAGANPRPIALGTNGGGIAALTGNTITIDGVISGAGQLTAGTNLITGTGAGTANPTAQYGNGTVKLTGTNSYTGGTVITNGTLNFSANALGSGGVTMNGGTLQWGTGVTTDITAGNTVTFNSPGGTFDTNANNVSLNTANITGTGAFTKAGNGVLTLGPGVTAPSGGVNVTRGALTVTSGAQLSTGAVSVVTPSMLNIGTSSTVAGALTINGTLTPGNAGTVSGTVTTLNFGSNLILNSGATLNYDLTNTSTYSQLLVAGALDINSGAGTITLNLYNTGATTTYTTPGQYELLQYGSLGGIGSAASFTSPTEAGYTYTYDSTTNPGFITLTISAAGSVFAWNTGAGFWSTGSNWNTITGVTSPPPNGAGQTATFDTTGTGGTVTLDEPVTVGTLKFNDSAQSYTVTPLVAGSDTITLDNSGNAAIVTDLAGTHTVAPNLALNSSVSVNVTNPGDTLTLSGSISDLGSHTLTKTGNGTLVLSGTNTYGPAAGTVGTILNAGTLQVASNAALGTGDLSATGNNTLQAGAATVTLPNNIIIGNGLVLTTDTQADSLTLNGVISDTTANGVLNVIGTGTLYLTATNTYGGGTILNGGTTNINSANSLGATTGNLTFNGGTLQLGAAIPVTTRNYVINGGQNAIIDTNGFSLAINSSISAVGGLGGLTKLGNGNLTLNNANTFNGTTTIDGGILQITNSTALQSSTLNYGNFGGSLDFGNLTAATLGGLSGSQNLTLANDTLTAVGLTVGNNNSTTTYNGVLSGTGGSLTKVGSGTLTLTGNNTYTGATNVNAGTVIIPAGAGVHGAAINPTGLFDVTGGTVTSSALSTITGGFGLGFAISAGSANFTAGMVSQANDGAEILVTGGTLTTTDINLRRTNNSVTVASPASGLVINGGAVNLNTLELGTENSSSSANITGGSLTTTGAVTVANQTSSARGGVIDVSGGAFTVGDTVNGLILVRNNGTGTNQNANVFLSGGVTTLGKLSFGYDNTVFAGSFANVTLTGGSLYIGSGGIAQNGLAANLTSNLLLDGGILGAVADWSSSLPMVLGNSTIQTADSTGLAHNITITGTLSGTFLPVTGNGTLTLGGINTYTGNTTVNGATLSITNIANGGLPSALGVSTNDPSNLVLTDATLQYTGPTASTDRSFTVADVAATLDASGSGNLTFTSTNPVTLSGAGSATLTFTGNNTGANTFNPVITDGAGPTSVVKNGPGQWILAGTNTYTGPTTVNAGTLQPVNLTSSSVTVNANATLAGPGTIGGDVALNANATLSPGGSAVGFLSVNSLSLASNVALNYIFANISSYDQVLSANSLSFNPGIGITLYTTGLAPLTSTGNYTIFTFATGEFTGDPNDLFVTDQQIGLDYSFVVNNTDNGIILEIASQGLLNSWNSTIGGSWATGSNWSNGSAPPADVIINFYSAITQNSIITLDGNRTAEGLRFSNNFSYTIADALGDNSNLTLDNGASNATIQVLAGNHTISAPLTLTAGGLATNITSTSVLTISGAIGQTATAALTNVGAGNLILSGLNTYTGPTNVDAGTVSVTTLANGGSPSSLGASSNAAANLVINGGTLRYIGSGSSTDRLFTIGTAGARLSASGTGPVNFTNPGSLAFASPDVPVTLTLSGSNTGTNTFSPTINDNGAGATSLTKTGTGLWLVNGNDTQTGVTTISGGTLRLTTLANGAISQSSTTFGPASESSCQTSSGSTNIIIGDTSALTTGMTVTGPGIPGNDTIATVNGDGSIDLVTPANSTATVALGFSGVPIVTVTDSTQFTVGQTVAGTGIPTGSTIVSIDNDQDTITLSQNATATNNSVNLNFFTASALGGSTNDASNLVIDGGTLQYVGPTATTDHLFTIGPNGTTIDSSGTGPLTFSNSSNLAFVGTTSTNLTLTGNNTGANVFTPGITDSTPGLTTLIKSGSGVWSLTGSNSYSGGTNITSGTLQIAADNELGATTGNLIIGNGTLETQGTLATTRSIILTSPHSTFLVDDGLSMTIGSNITGNGTLNFLGQNGPLGSTLFLGANSAYTGGTIVSGQLSISANAALGTGVVTLNNNSGLTVTNAPQSLGNTINIPAGATANLTFTSTTSTSYSGLLTNGSTASVLNFSAVSNPLTLNGSGAQWANFTGTLNVLNLGTAGLRLSTGAGGATITDFANMTVNLETTVGALFDHVANQTVVIGNLTGIPGSFLFGDNAGGTTNTTTVWQIGGLNANSTFSGNISDSTATAHSAVNKVGTGILTLNGTNNYSGGTTFTAGEIDFGNISNIGTGALTFNGGAIQWASGTSTDLSTLSTTFSTGGATFDTNGNAVTLANAVGGNGPGGLTVTGAGSLTLDSADAYNGTTTVSSGTLVIDNAAAIPAASTLSVASGATFNASGLAAIVGAISGAGNILLGSGGSLSAGGNNLSTTFTGVISGPSDLGFTKTGTGVLTLGGTSTYAGPTLVNAGNLVLTGALPNTSAVTVASGAVLGGNGSITNGLTLNSGGKLYLGPNGTNTLTVGSFTWNTNGTGSLLYVLQDLTTTDLLKVNGAFTKGTNPGGAGQFIFDFQDTGFFNGVYTLIDFAPGEANGFTSSDFTAINLRSGDSGIFTLDNADGTLIFNITVPEPATWALLTGAATLLVALRRRRRAPSI